MKTFYSVEDIENFAERGQGEIRIDENTVLTDMAKQTANMLGIRITEKPSGTSRGDFAPVPPSSPGKANAFGGKPRGCQRRPAQKSAPASGAPTGQSSRAVVDSLVEKIKRINYK